MAVRRALALLAVCCACAPRPTAAPESPVALHAIESEELVRQMRGLRQLSMDRLPQAMDLEQERAIRLYEVARIAAAIAASADQLPTALGDLELTDADRREFERQAEALERNARQLAKRAHELSPEALRAQATALLENCAACHRRFGITGVAGVP